MVEGVPPPRRRFNRIRAPRRLAYAQRSWEYMAKRRPRFLPANKSQPELPRDKVRRCPRSQRLIALGHKEPYAFMPASYRPGEFL